MVMRARIQLVVSKVAWLEWQDRSVARTLTTTGGSAGRPPSRPSLSQGQHSLAVISIKSHSYSVHNRKMTQNRFLEGEHRPELLDDWDQRLVVRTLIHNIYPMTV